MKSLFLLILVWLASQFGALILEGHRPKSTDAGGQKKAQPKVEAVLEDWPGSSRAIAKDVMFRLGAPDVVRQDLLRWDRRGMGLVIYRDKDGNAKHSSLQTAEAVPR